MNNLNYRSNFQSSRDRRCNKQHKTMGKNLRSKYSQKILDHTKQSATDALKTSLKRAILKTVEASGDLIGNKIADKITRVSETSPKRYSETNEEQD